MALVAHLTLCRIGSYGSISTYVERKLHIVPQSSVEGDVLQVLSQACSVPLDTFIKAALDLGTNGAAFALYA